MRTTDGGQAPQAGDILSYGAVFVLVAPQNTITEPGWNNILVTSPDTTPASVHVLGAVYGATGVSQSRSTPCATMAPSAPKCRCRRQHPKSTVSSACWAANPERRTP